MKTSDLPLTVFFSEPVRSGALINTSNHTLIKDVLEFKWKSSLTVFYPGWAAGAWPGRTRTGCPAPRPSWWHDRCPGWRRAPELSPENRNKIKVQQERQRVLPAAASSHLFQICPVIVQSWEPLTPLLLSALPGAVWLRAAAAAGGPHRAVRLCSTAPQRSPRGTAPHTGRCLVH